MSPVITVCVLVFTLAFVALAIQAIMTLIQIRHTARAMEYLALNADGKLSSLDPVISAMKTVSNSMSSGWFRIAQAVYGAFSGRKND